MESGAEFRTVAGHIFQRYIELLGFNKNNVKKKRVCIVRVMKFGLISKIKNYFSRKVYVERSCFTQLVNKHKNR